MRRLTVWIDFANSPHVPFFTPMIAELKARGHDVVLTARDFAQTVPLARQLDMPVEVIGAHGGSDLVRKSIVVLRRASRLAAFAREAHADLAVHHNSYGEAVAARLVGIPSVALMDYEYQPANHLSFRLASKVMVPAAIPARDLARFGCGRRLETYDGIKEDLYVPYSREDPGLRARLGVSESDVLAVLRPAPDMAAYHRFHNRLFDDLIAYLDGGDGVTVLVTARTPEQREQMQRLPHGRLRVLTEVVDGIALVRAADLVITAGGTMAREAAAAGTPAYSLFQGRLGAVDRSLEAAGSLTLVRDASDFDRVSLTPKRSIRKRRTPPDLLQHVTDSVLSVAERS